MKPSRPLPSTVVLAVMLCVLFLPCAVLADTVVTGTYSTGDGSDGNQTTPLNGTGPWTLTATNTTFSYLLFFPNENFTFAQMTNFNAVFEDIAGGAGVEHHAFACFSIRTTTELSAVATARSRSILALRPISTIPSPP